MRDTRVKIASAANQLFAERGFAEPGVEAVRAAADVSIRTLYKHFPSRNDMIVGALAFRHERYLEHLRQDAPVETGQAAILHLFSRLEEWMKETGTHGCLFVQALASHPQSMAIRQEVERNKLAVRAEISRRLGPDQAHLAMPLFLIHEGTTAASPSFGASEAGAEAVNVIKQLFRKAP
ncbi:TetR family transcriptional regulator [Mesorhizobium sp. B3-2-1]|uniref:TetR/AcrR family transcriptional regulator n=1 Tax=Mesorhizobium sp. B3-2-1 TaxID=2589891 RepID=UPI001125CDDD|nr:TetR/AcrR family transcriptional regulator [Mesorhizobium sp. B3-2-1]TPI27624.1 TetR family transcriptional regulator [Mesorhizobium sp. B3-2-1]